MKCQKCQNEVFLPFRCQYCGGHFCSEHRLPENHECPQIDLARTPKNEAEPTTIQKQKPYEYTVTYAMPQLRNRRIHFSAKEVKHLAVAALLVMGVGLSFGGFLNIFVDYGMLTLFTIILTSSFFIHELAHKIVAQGHGLWAEFRLNLIGAALTLISMALPAQLFKIISPGAVMVAGTTDRGSIGRISISGPMTNILLSTIFFSTTFAFPQYFWILLLGAAFNAWIALFNLIPLGILDGFKIFHWNKKLWALAFAASLILTLVSYRFLW